MTSQSKSWSPRIGGKRSAKLTGASPFAGGEAGGVPEPTLAVIDAAFAGAPRPPDGELLHERCFDDNDIAALYGVADRRDLDDATVEREYAALSFLSPAGFRHFIPAYLAFALRHLDSGAAAVDSTIWSLSPRRYDDPELQAFTISKLEPLDERERAAVVAFLEAVREHGDEHVAAEAELALAWWRER
jgi:hypothetical protein